MATPFFDQLKRAISVLSQREVKTPLSFFFRIIFFATVGLAIMVVWGRAELQELAFLSYLGLLVMCGGVVAVMAWNRPKNLVYGETGHRAELKLGYGTEKTQISATEVGSLPGTEKPVTANAIEKK